VNNMSIENYRFLILLYMDGSGGNHLANILSLSPKINPRFNSTNYKLELLEKYKNSQRTSAHYGEFCGIQDDADPATLDMLNDVKYATKPYVLLAGTDVPEWVYLELKKLGKIGIIQTLPDPLDPIFKFNFQEHQKHEMYIHRFEERKFDNKLKIQYGYDEFYFDKLRQSNLIKNTDLQNIYNIDIRSLMFKNIDDLLHTFNIELNLELDVDFVNSIHKIWLLNCFH